MERSRARAGSRIYNGFEIPEKSVIHTSKKGVEYYISGDNGIFTTIRYLNDGSYQDIKTDLIIDKVDAQFKECVFIDNRKK